MDKYNGCSGIAAKLFVMLEAGVLRKEEELVVKRLFSV